VKPARSINRAVSASCATGSSSGNNHNRSSVVKDIVL